MIRGVILDLDGTVYLGDEPVPGAPAFVDYLRSRDIRPLFVTNRANRTPGEIARHLAGMGIRCGVADVLTAAEATARHLPPGRVFLIGEEGMRRALEEAGHTVVEDAADYVVVSYDRGFNYERMERACRLIHAGARFVATNPDRNLKTDRGILPGTGAIVAAVQAGCGVDPVVVGKPQPLIMRMALQRLALDAADVLVVGDNLATDVPAGLNAGMRTVLILTGISQPGDVADADIRPTWTVTSYGQLQALIEDLARGNADGAPPR